VLVLLNLREREKYTLIYSPIPCALYHSLRNDLGNVDSDLFTAFRRFFFTSVFFLAAVLVLCLVACGLLPFASMQCLVAFLVHIGILP
jgi:hypothetical protein